MDDTSSTPTVNIFWRWLKRLYAAAVVIALSLALIAAWPALQHVHSKNLWIGALGTMIGWGCMVMLLGLGWAGTFKAWTGLQLTPRQCLQMQASAWIGRYLPGKIGLLAGKMQACETGASWKQVTNSVLSEQVAFIVSGLALSALALPSWLPLLPRVARDSPHYLLVSILLAPSVVFIATGIWISKRILPHAKRTWSTRLLLWSAIGHLTAGGGFHILLSCLLSAPPTLNSSVGLLAMAHTAGIIAVFAPAGLGVREAVIVAALAPLLGWTEATAITALQRAFIVMADASIGLFSLTNKARILRGKSDKTLNQS